jgi:hypothetical protein
VIVKLLAVLHECLRPPQRGSVPWERAGVLEGASDFSLLCPGPLV